MPPNDEPGPIPADRHLLRCSGCGLDIECPAGDVARYTRGACPACGATVVTAATVGGKPARNKRLVTRRAVRGGVRAEVRRGTTGLGKDLSIGTADLCEDGVGVRLRVAVALLEECEVILIRAGAGKPVKVRAEVRWCTPAEDGTFRAGLRFRQRLTRTDLMDLTK
ncbi:MAG TPA: PilZ domain-containing protein [Gemmataceae bacterium]|nr:PilZ domain-containing protein [Gemmataceae bacterium]